MEATRALLEWVEASSEAPDDALAPVASFLATALTLDEGELAAALRRAVLVLAAGGDPRRGLDPDGPAVRSLAADLDAPERRRRLDGAVARASALASDLPHVAAALAVLRADSELAWRWTALVLLADELGGDEA